MDGAVEAGERAAREVLHARGKIPENQICQTEPVSEVRLRLSNSLFLMAGLVGFRLIFKNKKTCFPTFLL